MALPYRRWTEEEVRSRNVSNEGEYIFEIAGATFKKSKGGFDKNGKEKKIYDMIEIDFNFHDENGRTKKQKDYIVFSDDMDWKLRHLAKSIGLIELYDSNELDCHHLIRKKGIFSLGIKIFKNNYGEEKKSNFVKDYLEKENKPKNDIDHVEDLLNDSIPF